MIPAGTLRLSLLLRPTLARRFSMAPAAPSSTLQAPAANTSKRDFLIELEGAAQKRWKAEKVFETNSPYTDGTEPVPTEDFTAAAAVVRQTHPKWFGTFPYPVSRRFAFRALGEEDAIRGER